MDARDELYPVLACYESSAHEHSKLSREEVRAHSRYALTIAMKYCQYGLPLSALVAEGKLGIAHALTNFDPERGYRLLTYVAYWIRICILNYAIHSVSSAAAASSAQHSKLLFKLRREKVRFDNLLGERNDTVAVTLGI